jgi:hypothetical protein
MKGYISTREKCFVCGKGLVHDERRGGCFCTDHPQVAAMTFVGRFGRAIYKRFKSYPHAAQFLNGLRFKTGEGTFDSRDYQVAKPFSFTNLSEKYLNRKRTLKSLGEVRNYIRTAQRYWGDTNVKEINGADIGDFLFELKIYPKKKKGETKDPEPKEMSEKTRANYRASLNDFWKWMLQRQVITLAQMPIFPKIDFELGYRRITDMDTQEKIIQTVYEMTHGFNPKIWLGIDLLATYVNLRSQISEAVLETGVCKTGGGGVGSLRRYPAHDHNRDRPTGWDGQRKKGVRT